MAGKVCFSCGNGGATMSMVHGWVRGKWVTGKTIVACYMMCNSVITFVGAGSIQQKL